MISCAIICFTAMTFRDHILMYVDWSKSQNFATHIYCCEEFTYLENMFIQTQITDLELMLYDVIIFVNELESVNFKPRHEKRILKLHSIEVPFHFHFISNYQTKQKHFERREFLFTYPDKINICVTSENTRIEARHDFHYHIFLKNRTIFENTTIYENYTMETIYNIAACCDYVDDKTISLNCFVENLQDTISKHIMFSKYVHLNNYQHKQQHLNNLIDNLPTFHIKNNPFQFKYIHQIWISDNIMRPTNMFHQKHQLQWKKMNPNIIYKLWHMKDVVQLIKTHYDDKTLLCFQKLDPFICKCDFARLLIVNIFSGLYVDCDFVPIKPIQNWSPVYDKSGLLLFSEITEHCKTRICNGLFGVENPQNIFLTKVINTIINSKQQEHDVMDKTGPQLWMNVLKSDFPNIIIQNGGNVMPVTNDHRLSQDFDSSESCWTYTEWNTGSGWSTGMTQRSLIIDKSNQTLLQSILRNCDEWYIAFIVTLSLTLFIIIFWILIESLYFKKFKNFGASRQTWRS